MFFVNIRQKPGPRLFPYTTIIQTQAGAWTMAQNEASCVVFGMPREAIALDAACEVVDLDVVSQRLLDSFNNNLQRKRAD